MMPAKTITLPNMSIQNIEADLVKGVVDVTFRGGLTLDLMKLRPELMDLALDGKPVTVKIEPPLSLLDQIELMKYAISCAGNS